MAISPIEAVETREEIDLESLFYSNKGVYVLRVRGESMIEDHLCDGDFVVIERRENARNGEQVVALLDTGEATLKRFYKEPGNKIRLQPANAAMEPWDYTKPSEPIDLELQKKLYEAFFRSWWGNPALGGFSIWEWPPNTGGPEDKGYNPDGKPALEVLKEWLKKGPWEVK